MAFFELFACGHHGYPQPDDSYEKLVYAQCCLRCGIHGNQSGPFRLGRSQRAPHSSFMQLNWVFDAFFVTREVAAGIRAAGISGVSFGPVLDHRSGNALGDRVQLLVSEVIACVEATDFSTVTCRPNNEESAVLAIVRSGMMGAGEPRFPPSTPYCGGVKYHPPKKALAINPDALRNAPDIFQSGEWFGSGCSAHRTTLASERFVALVNERGWRGLEFRRAAMIC